MQTDTPSLIDIAEKMLRIADASRREDGSDIPLGEQVREAADEITRLRSELNDYKEAHASKLRLTRELDVIINGEAGAAPQASLCDVVEDVRRVCRELSAAQEVLRAVILRDDEHDFFNFFELDALRDEILAVLGEDSAALEEEPNAD